MKKFFARLSSLERRFVVGVLVTVFVILNAMFVWPRFSDWGKMQLRISKARRTLALYQTNIADVSKYEKEVKAMESEGVAVPLEDMAVEFVRSIQSQAAQSGVTPISMNPQTARGTNQFFIEKAQGLSVQSREAELVDFLYRLGSGSSLIRVRDLSMRPDPSGMQLAANIKLVASYQKKPPARPAAPAAPTATTAAATPPKSDAVAGKPATPTNKKP